MEQPLHEPLAEKPPYGTAEAERWERRRNGLIERTAKEVRREIEAEEEHETAEDGTWQDSDLDAATTARSRRTSRTAVATETHTLTRTRRPGGILHLYSGFAC